MSAPKGDIVSGKAKVVNPVAEDQNWRISVGNELKSADTWNEDWGFLVHGDGMSLTGSKPLTKEEQIRKLEEQVLASKTKAFTQSSSAYGAGDTLEMFSMAHLNRTKNPDLMPCPRRPPKKKAAAE